MQVGVGVAEAARTVGTTARRLREFAALAEAVEHLFGPDLPDERIRRRVRQILGNLIELNMHFSLSRDLTPLLKYLETLRDAGYPKVTTLLERGDY
jgi:hypothetical protein